MHDPYRVAGRCAAVCFSTHHESLSMSISCPQCGSTLIRQRNVGRRAGGAVGTVAGGLTGVSGALTGGRVGMTVGLIAGPTGSAVGCIAGALLGGLIGAVTIGVAGAKLGGVLDERVLENYECLHCEHVFGETH